MVNVERREWEGVNSCIYLTTLLCKMYFVHFSVLVSPIYVYIQPVALEVRAVVYSSFIFSRSSHTPFILIQVFSTFFFHFSFSNSAGFYSIHSRLRAFLFLDSQLSTVQFVDSFHRPAKLKCIQFAQRLL